MLRFGGRDKLLTWTSFVPSFRVTLFRKQSDQKASLPPHHQGLNKLRCYPPIEAILLNELTFEVVMLLALLTSRRTQTIHCLDINHIDISDKKAPFT